MLYGRNVISVEVKSYGTLFIKEVLNPFYVFQIGSMVLWSLDNYFFYASCIFIISAISLAISLYETKQVGIFLNCLTLVHSVIPPPF